MTNQTMSKIIDLWGAKSGTLSWIRHRSLELKVVFTASVSVRYGGGVRDPGGRSWEGNEMELLPEVSPCWGKHPAGALYADDLLFGMGKGERGALRDGKAAVWVLSASDSLPNELGFHRGCFEGG